MKSMQSLLATVIIVAIVIAISVAYALWVSSMAANMINRGTIKLEFYDAEMAIKTILLYIKNTGSAETTITHVLINGREAKIMWAWDETSNKYIGYGEAPIKPGHLVEIAVRTQEFQLVPGVMVEFKILTSSGATFYRTIKLTAHPVLGYIKKGYFNAWDYDPEHFSAIYHQFWRYYGVDLYIGSNIEKLRIGYNIWYGLFQLGEDYTIIHEIRLYQNGNNFFFDIKAYKNGTIVFYDTVSREEVFTNFRVYTPHHIDLEFSAYPNNIVEFKLAIDGKTIVLRNYTGLYGADIVDECFGVWDVAGLYDMYIDNIVEEIKWYNGTDSVVAEDFNDLSTNYFTLYVYGVSSSYSSKDIGGYPVLLYNGKIGYTIDKI